MNRARRELTGAVAAVALADAMGLALLAAAFFFYQQSAEFVSRAFPVEGVVIAYDQSHPSGAEGVVAPAPVILFQTPRGEAHRFRAQPYTTWLSFEIGDRVPVLYDPRDPRDARLDSFWQLWAGTIAAAALGGLFIVAPAAALAWAFRTPAFRGAVRPDLKGLQ